MLSLWLAAITSVAKLIPVLIGAITGIITICAYWFAQAAARKRQAELEAAVQQAIASKDTTDLENLLKNR